jgi:hypothetical protein
MDYSHASMRHDMYGKVGASGKACERLFDQCPVTKSVKEHSGDEQRRCKLKVSHLKNSTAWCSVF